MRGLLVLVHRWAGLFIAVFLFIAGLTGAIISWAQEVDEWLNPDLFEAQRLGAPMTPLILASRFEARDPRARVAYAPLFTQPGKTLLLYVEPRLNPKTGAPFELGYNQVFLEPATGEVKGKRLWGRVSLQRQDLLPFLYKLHYTMHLPDFFGIGGLGIWLMGIVGIVWTIDCFVGLCLTLPVLKRNASIAQPSSPRTKSWLRRWSPAWKIKMPSSAYRLNFDVHRAAGLWAWLFLLILAFTSISMNLGEQVVRPLLGKVFALTPDAAEGRADLSADLPKIPFAPVVKTAEDEAAKLKWAEPPGSIFFNSLTGIYSVSFFAPGAERERGLEPKTLFIDGSSGEVLRKDIPWVGTFADVFMQLQFPLHSGRIAGLPGRIFLSLMGVIVASLSLTGIVIWFKKRVARRHRAEFFEQRGSWDEERLRQRVALLGRAAADAAQAPGPLKVSRIARLAIPAGIIFMNACSMAMVRAYRQIRCQIAQMSRPTREALAIVVSVNFWAAAWWDMMGYAHKLRDIGSRLRAPSRKF